MAQHARYITQRTPHHWSTVQMTCDSKGCKSRVYQVWPCFPQSPSLLGKNPYIEQCSGKAVG